jgi:hypothetical protein
VEVQAMNNEKWFLEHDVPAKIRQALEQVTTGHALHLAFAGLENGECTLTLYYNGETVVFVNKTHGVNNAEKVKVDIADFDDDPLLVASPKRRRRGKSESEEQEAQDQATVEASSEE